MVKQVYAWDHWNNNVLVGTNEEEEFLGGDGNDTIVAGFGDDIVRGQSDNDTLFGERGADDVRGGDGNDRISGGFASDEIIGSDSDHDLLSGGAGDDTLFFSGEDSYDGDSGTDTFSALELGYISVNGSPSQVFATASGGIRIGLEEGVAEIRGTSTTAAGEDHYTVDDEGGIDLSIGRGDATFTSIEEYELTDFGDYFQGDNSADTIFGFGGDDVIEGKGGADDIRGGTGSDTVEYGSAGTGVNVDLERGTGLIGDAEGDTYSSIENIRGTGSVDALYGTDQANTILGRGGDDFIEGRGGADVLDGNQGEDTVLYTSSTSGVSVDLTRTTGQFFGDAAGDILRSIEHVDGSAFSDVITGNNADNHLNGGDLNDTIDGGFGDDILIGGNGTDTVSFLSWDQTGPFPLPETIRIELGQGSQHGEATRTTNLGFGSIVSSETDDLIGFENVRGSNRAETIVGNGGVNVLEGRGSNDVLQGNGGGDTLDGGQGIDTASYEANSGRVMVTLGASGADGVALEFLTPTAVTPISADTLRSIENVRGSAFNDQITGNEADNTIDGLGGIDTMTGNGGNDTYIVDSAADIVVEGVGQGTLDRVLTSVSYALNGSEVEVLETTNQLSATAINLVGNNLNNTINGNFGANVISGGGGVDTMNGFGGNDTYIVDNSADVVNEGANQGTLDRVQTSVTYVLGTNSQVEVLETVNPAATTNLDLVGNRFDNTIIGNNGSNTIVGGMGLDTLVGNGGGDIFVWQSTAETGLAANEADIVGADFDPLVGDKLAFNPIDANELIAGDQAFTFIGQGPFTGAGQINTFTDGFDTYILLNTDGDAAHEATIRVLGVHQVDASWFVL